MIAEFAGEYDFLSNFYDAPVEYKGLRYKNNEAAFQGAKCPGRESEFTSLRPGQAKRLGRRLPLRADWEDVKEQVMYEVCKAKFTQNDDLRQRLLATGYSYLAEGNTWHDNEWGVCRCISCQDIVGKNKLGKILMRIRSELADEM